MRHQSYRVDASRGKSCLTRRVTWGPHGTTLAGDPSWNIPGILNYVSIPRSCHSHLSSHKTDGIREKTRATPTTKAGSISRIKTFCNWVKSPTSNRLSKPRSETHVDEECVRGVKSEEVHGTRYPDPSQEGPRMGCWGYSKNRTSVLIKRLLTTSFSVLCKQQQKAFIILAFLKLRNILKPL